MQRWTQGGDMRKKQHWQGAALACSRGLATCTRMHACCSDASRLRPSSTMTCRCRSLPRRPPPQPLLLLCLLHQSRLQPHLPRPPAIHHLHRRHRLLPLHPHPSPGCVLRWHRRLCRPPHGEVSQTPGRLRRPRPRLPHLRPHHRGRHWPSRDARVLRLHLCPQHAARARSSGLWP